MNKSSLQARKKVSHYFLARNKLFAAFIDFLKAPLDFCSPSTLNCCTIAIAEAFQELLCQ